MLAKIQLIHYFISKINMNYLTNSDFESNEVDFSHDIAYMEDSHVEVIINCDLKDEGGSTLSIELHGFFEVEVQDGNRINDEVRSLCEINTLSILFPYLRSAVSDITLKANIAPVILPTINIVELLNGQRQQAASKEESIVES